MRKTYKAIYDDIKPSNELLESVFEMRKKKKNQLIPRLASAALAFAVLATGVGFGVQYNTAQRIAENPIGSIIVANADEVIGESTTKIAYRLHVIDLTGMTDEEIYNEKIDLLKKLHQDVDNKDSLKNSLKNIVHTNGNALYATERGGVGSELTFKNIKSPEQVEKIVAKNSSKYGEIWASVDDVYFTNPEKGVYVFDNRNVDYDEALIRGNEIEISGERYAKCREIEKKGNKLYNYDNYYNKDSEFYKMELSNYIKREFYISYEFTDDFYDMLGESPTTPFSDYHDEITTKVYFKNGNVATTVLNVGINDKGYLTLQCKSYDYSKA